LQISPDPILKPILEKTENDYKNLLELWDLQYVEVAS
jgi:hypothetical protein